MDTTRYERRHGHPPKGGESWAFTLRKDGWDFETIFLYRPTYAEARQAAKAIACHKGAETIFVEP